MCLLQMSGVDDLTQLKMPALCLEARLRRLPKPKNKKDAVDALTASPLVTVRHTHTHTHTHTHAGGAGSSVPTRPNPEFTILNSPSLIQVSTHMRTFVQRHIVLACSWPWRNSGRSLRQ